MGLKLKSGMWCDYCARPVAGHKTTKKMAGLGWMLIGGLEPPGRYHCPSCGQPVRPLRPGVGAPRVATAPADPVTRYLTCTLCRGAVHYRTSMGTTFACPHCGGLLKLPAKAPDARAGGSVV
jgi:predicted RNA-binding Zn-ribbon protein involved in translation (DUF1610 family)